MENSYCLVFHHPVSRDITMLPRPPEPMESRRFKIAKRVLGFILKYWI